MQPAPPIEAVATGATVEEAVARAVAAARAHPAAGRPATPHLCGRIRTHRTRDGRLRVSARVRLAP